MITRKISGDSIVFYDDNTEVLTLREQEGDNAVTVEMKGRLLGDTAHEVQDELIALATVGINIVVDLTEVVYIAPTVQHVFLRTQQKIDSLKTGSLLLIGLSDTIFREFEQAGLSELLMIKH